MFSLGRLESRWGRWAVPNLTAFIVAGQAAFYVMGMVRGDEFRQMAIENILLKPPAVLQGEVWRLVTFAFFPPLSPVVFALIAWMLFYLFGSSLERVWGSFRFNAFVLVGYLSNVAAAFIAWWVWGLESPLYSPAAATSQMFGNAANALLYGSVFLAFARMFPDMIINLFFVLPIRIKWLGLLAWIGWGYSLIRYPGASRLLLLASVANYVLFFGREHWLAFRQGQRRRSFAAKTQRHASQPRHECCVCHLTSNEAPKTLFRYCSQCTGQKGYCPEHISSHEHK